MDQICSRRMAKLLIALSLTISITGAARAQAPTPPTASPAPAASKSAGLTMETPEAPDKVVLKVGDQLFTKADIDALVASLAPQAQRALAAQGKKPLADQFALMVMLSQQAHLHHLDQTPAFVQKLALQKRQLEAQAAYQEINDQAKVTPEEINQYYTAHSADYDEVMVRQFVVLKKASEQKSDPAHPTAATGSGLSPEDAKARAESIRKEVAAGTDIKKVIEDFKPPEVRIDSEPRKVRRGSMRPEMEKVAFALKDGEVSEPVDNPQALVFFHVTGHSHVDVKDVTAEIESKVRQEKVNAALAGVKKNYALWMDDQYFGAPPKPTLGPTLGAPTVKAPPKP
jgi:parvulin-like peptidyl-prolyl isomerase